MFKKLLVRLFLKIEVTALKIRLAEASHALNQIESRISALPKEAGPEVVKLASDMLKIVLGSADRIRSRQVSFSHPWQQAAYEAYEAGKKGELATYNYAIDLIDRSKPLF